MLHANIELITADTKFHAPYTHRIILLCEEKNIPYSLTGINLQNKPQWFLDINPVGEVPVMRMGDRVIAGSTDIACHIDKLSRPSFIPPEQWLNTNFATTLKLINDFGYTLVMFFRERKNTIPDLMHLNKFLTGFDEMLDQKYLSGDSISYLDFALIPHILQIYALDTLVFPFSMLIKHHNLSRWFELMIARDSVQFTSQNHAEHFIEHVQERGFFTQFGCTV